MHDTILNVGGKDGNFLETSKLITSPQQCLLVFWALTYTHTLIVVTLKDWTNLGVFFFFSFLIYKIDQEKSEKDRKLFICSEIWKNIPCITCRRSENKIIFNFLHYSLFTMLVFFVCLFVCLCVCCLFNLLLLFLISFVAFTRSP